MTRPAEHVTDTEAQNVLESTLPSKWVKRKQEPDYGRDYLIDIYENNEFSGVRFYVQLKGTKTAKYKTGAITQRIEMKHLKDYYDLEDQPVFIVVVDVLSKKGYWLFIQQYLTEFFPTTNWRNKNSITLTIPLANDLAKSELLKDAVMAANQYMKLGRKKLSPQLAIEKEQIRLESIDPRFNVKVTATDKMAQYIFMPKENIPIEFNFKDIRGGTKDRLIAMMKSGAPTTFESDEISISGSPLFAQANLSQVRLERVHPVVKENAICKISIIDSTGKELSSIGDVTGAIKGDKEHVSFEGVLPDSVLEIVCYFIKDGKPAISNEVKFSFDCSKWFNQPLLFLSYFDPVYNFVKSIAAGDKLIIQTHWRGNIFPESKAKIEGIKQLERMLPILEAMNKAREICRRYNKNPLFTRIFTFDEIAQLNDIYKLITFGSYKLPAPGLIITTEFNKENARKHLEVFPEIPTDSVLIHRIPKAEIDILGVKVILGETESEFTHVTLSVTAKQLRDFIEQDTFEKLDVEWTGTVNSEISVRLLS